LALREPAGRHAPRGFDDSFERFARDRFGVAVPDHPSLLQHLPEVHLRIVTNSARFRHIERATLGS
jgi:hypothetical protein